MLRPKLLCLVPVRNAAADLPDFFASARGFADGIIALDDGSTDQTRALLEAEPLVWRVIANPVRPDYTGWDDAANRNTLLRVAGEFAPEWILSLDADERVAAADAAALRQFVEHEALPGCAYGFTVFRMWQDMQHYDTAGLWVYRLFAWEPGQEFPGQKFHFVPVPTSIPRALYLRTTMRIQHLGGYTPQRREERYRKYQEVDPDNIFQHSYSDLLRDATEIDVWPDRPIDQPVLAVDLDEVDIAIEDATHPTLDEITDQPVISAIVISRGDGLRILRTVQSVVTQQVDWPFEVIVVTSGPGNAAELVRARYPAVQIVALPRPALPGAARNAGLALAKGAYLSFPGSHVELPPGSLQARALAHDLGYAMVTGAVRNGTCTPAGWASYFIDHSASLPSRPTGQLSGAPSHCSYRASALRSVGCFPEHLRAGEDTVVNTALTNLGYHALFSADIHFTHHSPCRNVGRLLGHHFVRGRGMGRIRRDRDGLTYGWLRPSLLYRQARRQFDLRRQTIDGNVARWADDAARDRYMAVRQLVTLALLANTLGTVYELLLHPHSAQELTHGIDLPASNREPVVAPIDRVD